MFTVYRTAIVVALLASCGSKMSKQECRERATAAGTYLESMDHGTSMFWLKGRSVPVRDDLPNTDLLLPSVDVTAKQISHKGTPVSADDLDERLAADRAKIEELAEEGKMGRNFPADGATRVYILAETDVPWSRIVEVATAARAAGMTRPHFVFARSQKVPPPPRTPAGKAFEAKLEADDGNTPNLFADELKRVIAGCSALTKAFDRAGRESGDRAGDLLRAVAPALIECNCSVDVARVQETMWLFLNNHSPSSALAIELDPAAQKLELPATTTWADASKQLAPGKPLWLAVK